MELICFQTLFYVLLGQQAPSPPNFNFCYRAKLTIGGNFSCKAIINQELQFIWKESGFSKSNPASHISIFCSISQENLYQTQKKALRKKSDV